jgi:uncharacterized protein
MEEVLLNRNQKRLPLTVRVPIGAQKGTALVLHGLGGWKDQSVIAQTADTLCSLSYRTLTFNAADGSRGPDGDFFTQTTSGYLKDLEDVMEQVRRDQEPFVLVGHSVGGLVALRYASEHPEQVTKLILLAPAVSWKMLWWAQLPFLVLWLVQGKRKWPGPKGEDFYLGRNWIFDFFTFDGYRYAQKVTVPTLVVSAEKDETVARPKEHAQFVRAFPKAEQKVVPAAAHAFTGHESEVTAIVSSWLTSS